MFTEYTYQDYLAAEKPLEMLAAAISAYKGSSDFTEALVANAYFVGKNTAIQQKVLLKTSILDTVDEGGTKKKVAVPEEVAGRRIGSDYLFRFVCQQNQYLLGNGVRLKEAKDKDRLGLGFDKRLQQAGEKAILHGVCWLFWNMDHMEMMPACKDAFSGCFALYDDLTGEPRAVVQFNQMNSKRPMLVRLFEEDGVTWYRQENGAELQVMTEKAAYKRLVARDSLGEVELAGENYPALPVVPLYANPDRISEFKPTIKSKIDSFDVITSDFSDNLDRANEVYWVLNNFGGDVSDIVNMLDTINRVKAVVNISDGSGGGSTAEAQTIEVPYAARETAIKLLNEELYKDWMAFDEKAITGGGLTNVAIQSALVGTNLKCDRFEWECMDAVQKLLHLIGIDTEEISFTRQSFVNKSEIVSDIQVMRQDIDLETALKLNPYILQEEIPDIVAKVNAQAVSGMSSAEELQKMLERLQNGGDLSPSSPDGGEDEEE